MPGLDRTGPQGQGSRTGRGLGKCNPSTRTNNDSLQANDVSEESGTRRNYRMGKGAGLGKGRRQHGRGRGNF